MHPSSLLLHYRLSVLFRGTRYGQFFIRCFYLHLDSIRYPKITIFENKSLFSFTSFCIQCFHSYTVTVFRLIISFVGVRTIFQMCEFSFSSAFSWANQDQESSFCWVPISSKACGPKVILQSKMIYLHIQLKLRIYHLLSEEMCCHIYTLHFGAGKIFFLMIKGMANPVYTKTLNLL